MSNKIELSIPKKIITLLKTTLESCAKENATLIFNRVGVKFVCTDPMLTRSFRIDVYFSRDARCLLKGTSSTSTIPLPVDNDGNRDGRHDGNCDDDYFSVRKIFTIKMLGKIIVTGKLEI